MNATPDLAAAVLIGDPSRAAMLSALLGGYALPAGELARRAGICAQTASAHLARLVATGTLCVTANPIIWRLVEAVEAPARKTVAAPGMERPPFAQLSFSCRN